MRSKCPNCKLVNFHTTAECTRCGSTLYETENITPISRFLKSPLVERIFVFLFASAFTLAGFFISLVLSAKPINYDERKLVFRAIGVLEDKGFDHEVFLLRYVTTTRANDNWLNASIEKENAYAATNFPFEIMTLYPEFFEVPIDDIERAAILLHESKHLEGMDEKAAYEFVWKNREKLGWTFDRYNNSVVWQNVRKQTKEYSPGLFVCDFNEYGDCTELRKYQPARYR